MISKRHEPSAVARNTIKRRWRAAFRRGCDAWAREFGGADVVVRMQSPLIGKSRPAVPARVRARDRFEPQALFDALAARLRGRRAGGDRVVDQSVDRSVDRSGAAMPATPA